MHPDSMNDFAGLDPAFTIGGESASPPADAGASGPRGPSSPKPGGVRVAPPGNRLFWSETTLRDFRDTMAALGAVRDARAAGGREFNRPGRLVSGRVRGDALRHLDRLQIAIELLEERARLLVEDQRAVRAVDWIGWIKGER